MTNPVDDLELRRRHRAVPVVGRMVAQAEVGAHPLAAAVPAPLPAEWAEEFVGLLQREIRLAARHGVITSAECEQLLARLVVVIDQALSTR